MKRHALIDCLTRCVFCICFLIVNRAQAGSHQIDSAGNSFVSFHKNETRPAKADVGQVQSQTVRTVAGNGSDGFGGDGGLAVDAAVSQPFGVVIGPDKCLYVCQVGSHVIRKVDLVTGKISTVAGNGEKGFSSAGQLATAAPLNEPYEVRFSTTREMYFVQMQNHVVSKVERNTGRLVRIAGTGQQGFSGDGESALKATFNRPHSIALDSNDNVYICDIGNHRIRKVDSASGVVTTFSGTGAKKPVPPEAAIFGTALMGPRALDIDTNGDLILALREGNAIYRMQMQQDRIQHLAGTGKKGFSGDLKPATTGRLAGPKGVAVAANSDIYFADTENHVIRVIRHATGQLQTVVGDGTKGNGPDGPALQCRLDRPHSVCLNQAGDLYIGDSNNHKVRVLLAK